MALKVIVGVLFWWRAVKALSLLDWPFMFGMHMGMGQQTAGDWQPWRTSAIPAA